MNFEEDITISTMKITHGQLLDSIIIFFKYIFIFLKKCNGAKIKSRFKGITTIGP